MSISYSVCSEISQKSNIREIKKRYRRDTPKTVWAEKCRDNRSGSMCRSYTYVGQYSTIHKYSTIYGIYQGQKQFNDFRSFSISNCFIRASFRANLYRRMESLSSSVTTLSLAGLPFFLRIIPAAIFCCFSLYLVLKLRICRYLNPSCSLISLNVFPSSQRRMIPFHTPLCGNILLA